MNNNLNDDKVELLGGIGIDLSDASKQMLFDLMSQLISEKDYFQSHDLGYTYINGNVTKKGHITICYGVKNPDLKKQFDNSKLKINWQHSALIKDIQINLGYQDLYYVVVAIPEISKDIYSLNDWVRANNDLIPDSPSFEPHIALCYIKNQRQLPSKIFKDLQEKLISKTIEFQSVNFYSGDNKIGSISL